MDYGKENGNYYSSIMGYIGIMENNLGLLRFHEMFAPDLGWVCKCDGLLMPGYSFSSIEYRVYGDLFI